MLRAMYSGIGGMQNFQTKMDVIGNNIANVNTFGYKKGRATFQDLVSQQMSGAGTPAENRGGTNPMQVGLGGSLATVDTIQTQGSMQTTGRDLDMGITGDGFFIVNDGNQSFYTRAGNFYLDQQGNLVASNGMYVQGYPVDEEGNINAAAGTGNLQITAGAQVAPEATDNVTLRGNLKADDPVNTERTLAFNVVDDIGTQHPVAINFTKTADNTWSYSVNGGGTQSLTFSGGSNDAPNGNIQIQSSGGGGPFNVEIDFSQITQYASPSTVDVASMTGNIDGTLESYSISQTGEINGIFSNGEVRLLGQIALAAFNNPGGLSKAGDSLFQATNNSGNPQVGLAGIGGRGTMTGSALEMSNVDLAEEFAEMIVTQRGFQANTRMITTSDEILQELVNLKR
ncbi:flagellar basal-body rod protein FlgF [Evansella sp. LMS18]|uniref:flagellar basal-body rod protein FlgF n=1 Tax=Evansella sp. LMS18 TaxID=2924033 RepID=UPI0020CFF977|nr:flagellar basal-body rod protein FlgF [Evansella sp. LMS18]UTR10861.1 flagellar basal-body rod protein FlgF [Evansella sp. LMS18]